MTTTEHPAVDLWSDDATDTAYHHGYADGRRDGLAARPPATVYLPVPSRWRNVAPGDTFVSGKGDLWHVQAIQDTRGGRAITAVCGPRTYNAVPVDPDEAVTLLVQTSEADAITTAADLLGARIIGRTNTDAPG